MGKFKQNDIKDLVYNIRNNTISERQAKRDLNALNEIKKSEIKSKRFILRQKELLNLFDDLFQTIQQLQIIIVIVIIIVVIVIIVISLIIIIMRRKLRVRMRMRMQIKM